MRDKSYRIILALTLKNASKCGSMYDVTMLSDNEINVIEMSGDEYENMEMEKMNYELSVKYEFMIGFGDYDFLDASKCQLLKEYLENDLEKGHAKLAEQFKKLLIGFCNKAIELNTGIGFDY